MTLVCNRCGVRGCFFFSHRCGVGAGLVWDWCENGVGLAWGWCGVGVGLVAPPKIIF